MATVYSAAGSTAVKVRDLSPNGALIEGNSIPAPPTTVRLCRGSLEIAGELVWCSAGRAGIKFNSAILVLDWLPRALAKSHQQRTDEAVQAAKLARQAHPISPANPDVRRFDRMSACDLRELKDALESLAEDLAADPAIIERHLAKLQTLDLVVQALCSVARER